MFTLPDNADAAPTCPALSPPGPHPNGFFQDCGSGAGTIPTAEDFNELILNLRALLAHAGVAGVKGDATMLWRCIQQMIPLQKVYTIDSAVTLNVAPGGSANPGNPLGGQPFDNLASALAWLAYYSITERGSVVIQMAAGVYNFGGSITVGHPNGDRITIAGAAGDPAGTLLNFPSSDGLVITGYLAAVTSFTVQGAKIPGRTGVRVRGFVAPYVLVVESWDVAVIVEGGGYLAFNELDVSDTSSHGVLLIDRGVCSGNALNLTNIAFGIGAPTYVAGLSCNAGGVAWIDTITCVNTHKGLDISGAGSEVRARRIQVHGVDPIPDGLGGFISIAVEANDGAVIIASGGVPGDWHADSPSIFWANFFGLIRSDTSFNNWSHVSASPAAQVLGNVNSMVWANSTTPPAVP